MTKNEITKCDQLVLKACLSKDPVLIEKTIREWDILINIDDLSFRSMRLCPLLLYKLNMFDIQSLYHKRLTVLYRFWWVKSKLIHDNINSVCKLLNDHNIKPVILKGGSVSHYYPKPELRTMSDIDLMVPFINLEESLNLLESLEYKIINSDKNLIKRFRSFFYYFHEPVQLKNDKLDVEIDLHWSGGTLLSKDHGNSLYKRTIDAEKVRNTGYIPTSYDELALILLHGTLTDSFDNYNWLLDIQILNEILTEKDWQKAYEISIKEKKEDYFIYGLNQLKENGINVPFEISETRVSQPKFTTPLKKVKESRIRHYWIAIKNSVIIIRNLFPHENGLKKIVRILQFFLFNLLKGYYIKKVGR